MIVAGIGVNSSASISQPLAERGKFCVSILARAQADFCSEFVALGPDKRFNIGDWEERNGIPFLPDAQASIFCSLGPVHRFGTHDLVVGLVEEVRCAADVQPLIYVDARFGTFAAVET